MRLVRGTQELFGIELLFKARISRSIGDVDELPGISHLRNGHAHGRIRFRIPYDILNLLFPITEFRRVTAECPHFFPHISSHYPQPRIGGPELPLA